MTGCGELPIGRKEEGQRKARMLQKLPRMAPCDEDKKESRSQVPILCSFFLFALTRLNFQIKVGLTIIQNF